MPGAGVGAEFVGFLADARGVLDDAVGIPLDRGHRLGHLQPLRGRGNQPAERGGAICPDPCATDGQRTGGGQQCQHPQRGPAAGNGRSIRYFT